MLLFGDLFDLGGSVDLFDLGGGDNLFAVGEVAVAPEITSNGGGATASVNVAENTTLVTTVQATGTPTPTYSITGGADDALFTINSATGELRFLVAPDYENPTDSDTDNEYVVEVTATNTEGTDAQEITVTITDVENEAPGGVSPGPRVRIRQAIRQPIRGGDSD